jgi:probable addiction module antidote protein
MAKLTPFDAAKYLDSTDAIAAYISDALEEGSPDAIAEAIGTVARARGMTEIAEHAGLSRENLYRALKAGARPEFNTVMQVLRALDVKLSASQDDRHRSSMVKSATLIEPYMMNGAFSSLLKEPSGPFQHQQARSSAVGAPGPWWP